MRFNYVTISKVGVSLIINIVPNTIVFSLWGLGNGYDSFLLGRMIIGP